MSFSDVLHMAKLGQRDVAAILLKEEFGKLQSPEQRVNLCRWIAACFEGLGEYASAAEWYEMSGLLSLGRRAATSQTRYAPCRNTRRPACITLCARTKRRSSSAPP